jgi:hypothetical protein
MRFFNSRLRKIPITRLITFTATAAIYLLYPREVLRFRRRLKRWPSPGNPRTFADKMLWRKVFDRNPLFPIVSDKLRVKSYASERVPDLLSPRTLWSGDHAEDIPSDLLNGSVVVKANHASGLMFFVISGEIDRAAMNAMANQWLMVAYHKRRNEWGYADIDRRLMVEEMLMDGDKPVRKELKFHVFGGRVYLCNFILDRGTQTRSCAFRRDGTRIGPIGIYGGDLTEPLPDVYPRAVAVAEALSADFDYIRCDLYVVDDNLYLGELTVYGQGGYTDFKSTDVMHEMGERWNISQSWFLTTQQPGFKGLYADALRTQLQ